MTRIATIAWAAATLFACGGTVSQTEPTSTRTSTQLASASESQGAFLIRDEVQVFFIHFDEQRGLLSLHFPSDICEGAPLNVGDRLIVETPSQIQQRLVQIKDGDSRVAIYRASSPDELFADFCGFLAGPTKVAEGTVRHGQTFSNASFAAHWGGFIEGVDGQRVHLSEVYQLTADVHDPNNPDTWSLNASQILLSPQP